MKLAHLTTLFLAVLLLPLLVACGGSPGPSAALAPTAAPAVPTSLPIPAAPPADNARIAERPPAAPAPTSAPAIGDEAVRAPELVAPVAPGSAADAPPALIPYPTLAPGEPYPTIAPAAPIGQQQYTPLKAGEVDDNRDFSAYLSYLATFQNYGVHPVDISERILITIVNERQQPVLDAQVRIYSGQQTVFNGRTTAGGLVAFFPRAIGLSQDAHELQVEVTKGQARTTGQIVRGFDDRPSVSFVLRGAQALPQTPRLEVLFLLDATGSMGDEISSIQGTITDIAARIDRMQPRPELRFGLISYRDRGDEYVTRLETNFTGDVGAFRDALMRVSAGGGGDNPEDLNSGLQMAMQQMQWSGDAVRLTFLVADAPAHLDYGQTYDYAEAARDAVAHGVKIYPIGASNTDPIAEYQFRQLAQQTLATFIFLTYQPGQNGGAPGETTTHDVDPQQFSVDRLDDLVVRVVERELRLAAGA